MTGKRSKVATQAHTAKDQPLVGSLPYIWRGRRKSTFCPKSATVGEVNDRLQKQQNSIFFRRGIPQTPNFGPSQESINVLDCVWWCV